MGDRAGDQDLDEEALQEGGPADSDEEPVREVCKKVESMSYLVRLSQIEQQVELWPEGEFISEVAKELDLEDRHNSWQGVRDTSGQETCYCPACGTW